MPLDPLSILAGTPVIPVLTIERVAHAVPLARALAAGGLAVIEVTLRTSAALDAVQKIAAEVPACVVGVGTVTKPSDIAAAVRAGAKFLVSPGTTAELGVALAEAPIPALPGAATVSEAMALADHGFAVLKFFPAEPSGGIAWLKAVLAAGDFARITALASEAAALRR
jgi:2-dehydro-3-deoxyphosphogluconate aldolase/(4S)-4-hydroxy-2-oxoglutarate aldolase